MMKITAEGARSFSIGMDNLKRVLPKYMAEAINASLIRIGGQTEANLQNKYLMVRSGLLSGSFKIKPAAKPNSLTGTLKSNVRYAEAQNSGFKGVVQVRGHARRIKAHAIGKSGRKLKKRVVVGQAFVRSHQMKMNIKATHYFDDAVERQRPSIEGFFRIALKKSIAARG